MNPIHIINKPRVNILKMILYSLLISVTLAAAPTNRKKTFTDMSGEELSRILNMQLYYKSGEKYSGYYFYDGDDKTAILHGDFFFKYEKKIIDPESKRRVGTKIVYGGQYEAGRPAGLLHLSLHSDDGVDLYASYEIDLLFEDRGGLCKLAIFNGVIGHAMPETSLQIPTPQKCDFEFVAQTAWNHWSRIHESEKKKMKRP